MYLCYSDKILASLRVTVTFFRFSLLERCCTIAAFTCWWTFEKSWFFFLFWGQGWKLSDCLSANPSPVAFERALQLHLNLKEGRNLEGASFMKTQSWVEERNLNVCPTCGLRERQEQLNCYTLWLQAAGQSAWK